MDKLVLQTSVFLRILSEIYQPHSSVCNAIVNCLGHHSLSCIKSSKRFAWHNEINVILKRAF